MTWKLSGSSINPEEVDAFLSRKTYAVFLANYFNFHLVTYTDGYVI